MRRFLGQISSLPETEKAKALAALHAGERDEQREDVGAKGIAHSIRAEDILGGEASPGKESGTGVSTGSEVPNRIVCHLC